jgi:hypothetical protein
MHPPDLLRFSLGGVALLFIAAIAVVRGRSAHYRVQRSLAAAQIALAMPLIICAGLLARSTIQVHLLDPEVSGEGSRRAVLALRTDRYGTPEQRRAFFDSVVARLGHVPGIRVVDTDSALPLAGNNYYAMFFSIGGNPPKSQPPQAQRFILWMAEVDADSLALEVNSAVKGLDRGIHYWHVGQRTPMDRLTLVAFGLYAAMALLLVYIGFRGDCSGRGTMTAAVGIIIGLGVSWAVTWLLTGLLFGVSVTDAATFSASSAVAAVIVLLACYLKRRSVRRNSSPAIEPSA